MSTMEVDHVAAEAVGGEHLGIAYYRSFRFIGTIAGCGLSLLASYAGFIMSSSILSYINASVGPDPNYVWIPLVWTTCLALGYLLNGRLSDLFGRRYFVIGGNCFCLIGGIISATANTIPTLIGGGVFIGLGTAVQLSFTTIVAELVPVKDRGYWVGLCLFIAAPIAMFGPFISHALLQVANWRYCFYIYIILCGISIILFATCYWPPTFAKLHTVKTKKEIISHLDFGGVALYVVGVVLFLLGLSWGGSVYPWKSAAVISTIVIGTVVLIAFFFYESRVQNALMPFHFFSTNKRIFLAPLLTGVGAGMFFYGLNIVWPLQVATVYGGSLRHQGWLSCTLTSGSGLGAIIGGVAFLKVGHHRLQLIVIYVVLIVFCGLLSTTDREKKSLALASTFLIGFGVGSIETIVSLIAMVSKDVGDIGLIVGSVGAFRSIAGSLAQAVYSAILTNKLNKEIPAQVTKAALGAGLPPTSLLGLFQAIGTQSPAALQAVPGMTTKILEAVELAEVAAYTIAFRYIYYASIAFAGASLVAAFFVIPDVNVYMTAFVGRKLAGLKASEESQAVAKDYEAGLHEAGIDETVSHFENVSEKPKHETAV